MRKIKPKYYGFKDLPEISDKEAAKIGKVLNSILEKSHLPYKKTWEEIKKSIPNFQKIEL